MRKTIFIITSIFFLCKLSHAQKIENERRWVISGFYIPEYSYRFVNNRGDYVAEEKDLAKYGYSTGVSLGFKPNQWLILKTGLNFSNAGFITWPRMNYVPQEASPDNYSDFYKEYYNYKFRMISIPVKVGFILYKSDFFCFGSDVGIQPSLVIDQTVRFFGSGHLWDDKGYFTTDERFDHYEGKCFWATTQLDFAFNFKKFRVGLVGGFKVNLSPLITNDQVYYIYSVGGGIEVGYVL